MYETAAVNPQLYKSQGQLAQAVGPKESVIESATNTITEAARRVESLVAQVRSLADSTFGTVPTPAASEASPYPPSSGRAENLQRAGGTLHSAITTLEAEVMRLRTI